MKRGKIYMDSISILQKLKLKKNFECGEPQNEAQIRTLEEALNVKFSASYKQFLKMYGYASFSGGHIFGPSKDPYYDLITRNKKIRAEKLPEDFLNLPEDAFAIDRYPGGGYFMLFGKDSSRAGEVGLFLSETAYQEEDTWDSFEQFLAEGYCSDEYL